MFLTVKCKQLANNIAHMCSMFPPFTTLGTGWLSEKICILPWKVRYMERIRLMSQLMILSFLTYCGPRISIAWCVSHSDGELDFYLKNWFLLIVWKKWLGVATYFCFIFKRVNKIRKKNPKCDSLFGKGDLRKTGSGSGVRLLIGKVQYGP